MQAIRYNGCMKLSRVLFLIAAVIVGVWLLGLVFRLAAWLISSFLYVAAVIVVIGIIHYWWTQRGRQGRNTPTTKKRDVIDAEIVEPKK